LVAGDEENIVLDCYRLAEVYHQNPEVFLAMPIDDVRRHLLRTGQLRRLQAAEAADG
jgi:hypothetical protein